MSLVRAYMVQCDTCRGMLRDSAANDGELTMNAWEATSFPDMQIAAERARTVGWRVWTSFNGDGSEYVSRVDCPKDIT